MATILTKKSDTASSVPSAAQLTNSATGAELAVNTADKRLYTKDSGGNVVELGTNPSTLALPSGTANGVAYLNASKVLTTGSALTFDGTNFATTGTATATKLIPTGNVTAGNGMYLPTTNTLAWSNNGSETMRLDSSGNLGLGVTPSAWDSGYKAIQISGTYSSALMGAGNQTELVTNAYYGSAAWRYIGSSVAASRYGQESGAHKWFTAPSGTAGNAISFTQAMTLDASGNLKVGTTATAYSATERLSVNAPSGSGGIGIATPNSNVIGLGIYSGYTATGTATAVQFQDHNSVVRGSITVTTSATAYNTSSDYRLKNITGPVTNSGAYIDSLKPVEGTWKADGSPFVGLIAHEVQEVSRTQVATGEKDGEQMQAMDYSSSEIIANLIAEVQSLRKRLAAAGIA